MICNHPKGMRDHASRRAVDNIHFSPMEKKVLIYLLKYGEAKPSKIAKELGLKPASVRRVLQQLRKKRWLVNENGTYAPSELCKTLAIQNVDANGERVPAEIQDIDPSSEPSAVIFGIPVDVPKPQLEKLFNVMMRRLLFDPSKSCHKGHSTVKPYPSYKTKWGPVQRFYCSICRQTYSELVKPKQAFEAAVLLNHYFGRTSTRRLPPVFQFITKAVAKDGAADSLHPTPNDSSTQLNKHRKNRAKTIFHVSTAKRIIRKYALIATYATPDTLTMFFHPKLSGFFAIDGFNIPTRHGKRICLIVYDLVNRDVVSLYLSTKEQPTENLDNCKRFIRRFKETMDRIRVEIRQILLDDREQLWQACLEELPSHVVLTLDSRHFIADMEEKIPMKARTPKAEGLLAEITFAIRESKSKEQALQILQHVRDSRDHWLDGETERVRRGVYEILTSLNELNISRLLSFFNLVAPGRRKHFRSTNPMEGGAVGVFKDALSNLNCLQSNETVPGQVNLIALISRLMPSTKDGRSSFQRGRVKKTLDDLITILLMFDPDSPIQ